MQISVRLFSAVRSETGTETLTLDLPDGATVRHALDELSLRHEKISPWLPSCRAAVGVEFASDDTVLKEGDVLALIPPVQGGSGDSPPPPRTVILTSDPLTDVLDRLFGGRFPPVAPGAGGVVEFWGVVRGMEDGAPISGIDYEAYPAMAEHQIHRILDGLVESLPLLRLVVIHRTGTVPAGRPSLYVRIESPHRKEAFDACREFVERLKKDVPIWKRPNPLGP